MIRSMYSTVVPAKPKAVNYFDVLNTLLAFTYSRSYPFSSWLSAFPKRGRKQAENEGLQPFASSIFNFSAVSCFFLLLVGLSEDLRGF